MSNSRKYPEERGSFYLEKKLPIELKKYHEFCIIRMRNFVPTLFPFPVSRSGLSDDSLLSSLSKFTR